jgi:hypothetical protein
MHYYRFGPDVRVQDPQHTQGHTSLDQNLPATGKQAQNRIMQQQRRNQRTSRSLMMKKR